jgi:predicted phage terminase large subunit-like protein
MTPRQKQYFNYLCGLYQKQKQQIDIEKARDSFYYFVQQVFNNSVKGRDNYKMHWSNQELCEYLELAGKGKIDWLLLSYPRGYGKSIFVSELYPAWCLLRDPSERIGCFTKAFTADANIWHEHSHDIYNCPFAKAMQTEKHKIIQYTHRILKTNSNGYRRIGSCQASSIGSDMTKVVIDDPHSEEHERSEALRVSLDNFYRKGIFPAIRTINQEVNFEQLTVEQKQEYLIEKELNKDNIKLTQPPVLVHTMQRLHRFDMQGVLIDIANEFKLAGVVKNVIYNAIPSIAPEKKTYIFPVSGHTYTVNEGEYLEAGTLNENIIKSKKIEMGESTFETQMQQNPLSSNSDFIKASYLNNTFIGDPIEMIRNKYFEAIIMSCDTAAKKGTKNDNTAITIAGIKNSEIYILHVLKIKEEYEEIKNRIENIYWTWQPTYLLIEDASTGTALLSHFKEKIFVHPVTGLRQRISALGMKTNGQHKQDRLRSCIDLFVNNRILVPMHANWLTSWKDELLNFPNHNHDDQVDSLTYLLMYYKNEFMNNIYRQIGSSIDNFLKNN